MKTKHRGNCYVTCEALYHLLGGKKNGYMPMVMRHEGDTHWFLRWEDPDHLVSNSMWSRPPVYLDPTASQFKSKPRYSKARGCGFLTKKPSKRAKELMKKMVWQ